MVKETVTENSTQEYSNEVGQNQRDLGILQNQVLERM